MAHSIHEPVGHIGLIGIDHRLSDQINLQLGTEYSLIESPGADHLFEYMQAGRAQLDTVVVGLPAEDAVRVAQRIHTHDKLIPVLILCAPTASVELGRTLMFSPFVGNEVSVWPNDEVDILPATLRQSVQRHQQRVAHRNTLSTAQIRLEHLPLQKPDARHYLDRLLDHAPVGVITTDLAGKVITANQQAQNILTSNNQALLGQPISRFFSGGERKRLAKLQENCAESSDSQCNDIFELTMAEDQTRYIEVTLAPLAYRTGQRGFMLILQDVTSRVEADKERQRAEEDLRHHAVVLREFHEITSSESMSLEEKLDAVLQLGCEQFRLPTGILTRVEDEALHVIRSVGDNAKHLTGSTKELTHSYCGITLEAAEPLAFSRVADTEWREHPAYLHSGQRSYIGTSIQVDDDVHGTLCFFSARQRERPFNSADSELIKLMSRWVGSELQRQRADALMRKLSGALERTADVIIITDRNRYIEYVNSAFESLTGYEKEEVVGKKTYFLRSGLHDNKFYDELWDVIGKGEVYRGTIVNRKKDGSLYYEQKTISPLRNEHGSITHFISAGHDITDLIEAEEKNRAHQAELAHVARLSTLGEMTSGLAHELNQPLCAITTYAQTCLHILQAEDCSAERISYGLEQVVKQAGLASAIFSRLRDFARKGEIQKKPVDVAAVVKEVVDFVTAEAQQKLMRIHHDVPAQSSRAFADPIQLEQVLLNLVRNAMDAVGSQENARRTISISARTDEEGSIAIEIRDQGGGCREEMRDRLFEPFVTSKSKGLGIGLSISQGIIEAHGGRLWLAENSDAGATFCFTLPTEATN